MLVLGWAPQGDCANESPACLPRQGVIQSVAGLTAIRTPKRVLCEQKLNFCCEGQSLVHVIVLVVTPIYCGHVSVGTPILPSAGASFRFHQGKKVMPNGNPGDLVVECFQKCCFSLAGSSPVEAKLSTNDTPPDLPMSSINPLMYSIHFRNHPHPPVPRWNLSRTSSSTSLMPFV